MTKMVSCILICSRFIPEHRKIKIPSFCYRMTGFLLNGLGSIYLLFNLINPVLIVNQHNSNIGKTRSELL